MHSIVLLLLIIRYYAFWYEICLLFLYTKINLYFRCGHCKKLGPELDKAAKVLEKREKPIRIGKVDATIETDLGTQFDVTGYPKLLIFRNGKYSEYKGPRNEPGMKITNL